MSHHLAAHMVGPKHLSVASAPYFLLGLSASGLWVVRETTGKRAGIFRSREAAIKYVRSESLGSDFTILYQPEGLEFESPIRLNRAA